MASSLRWARPVAGCLLASLLAAAGARETAPSFGGVDLATGQPIRLEDYRGKVVLVDFWASWCAPCVISLPAYDRIREEIGTDGFEIIAVNVDQNTEDALAFLDRYPVGYPVIADPEGEIGIPFGIRTLPRAFLLDRAGRIVLSHRGFRAGDEEKLKREIESLLAEAPG